MAPRSKKKVDPLKAKAAKQKKIAIGGMAVLCLLGAVQGPKTLKMLKGPQPIVETTSPAPAAAPTGAAIPLPGAPLADDATAAAASMDLATVSDSDASPVAADGQLVSFERFESKDPFAPQATTDPVAPASSGAGASDGAAPSEPSAGAGSTGGQTGGQTDGEGTVDGGFTPAPADGSPAAPAAPSLAAATSISVNGTAENVVVDTPFPATLPTFQLVSVAKNGKSVELGIAGGSYANGEQTIRLTFGKKLTLQNTADGTRYELELLSVAGFAVPKS